MKNSTTTTSDLNCKINFNNILTRFAALLMFIMLHMGNVAIGQSIFSNTITGTNPNNSNPYVTGQIVNANITVSGIGRGSQIAGTDANDRYNANGWNQYNWDQNDYFYFTITPNPGYEIDFVTFVYTGQRSGTGPTNFSFRSSIDNYSADIGVPTATGTTILLDNSIYQNITSSITFRFYGWFSSSSGGTFSINDFTFNGNVNSISLTSDYFRSKTTGDWTSSSTWESSHDGTTWFNATLAPTVAANTITILNGHTVTSTGALDIDQVTVNAGGTLATNATLTNSGTLTVNGVFKINQGGWATGGTWTYAAAGSGLIFNNSSGSYGVNDDVFWPVSNGPDIITVMGAGGITMNVARTVGGTVQNIFHYSVRQFNNWQLRNIVPI
ncbi:MAG: hypothetical protein IPH57_06640 [Saprospiraceae bacterium]|nr:hypothetical protein [Saprospiraceae bacterium]